MYTMPSAIWKLGTSWLNSLCLLNIIRGASHDSLGMERSDATSGGRAAVGRPDVETAGPTERRERSRRVVCKPPLRRAAGFEHQSHVDAALGSFTERS